jgi:hypothetical protein
MAKKLFNIRLATQDRKMLAELADREQLTVSDTMRKLIRQAATNERRQPESAGVRT